MKELEKAYQSGKYEDDIYQHWEESGFFNPDVCVERGVCGEDAEPFTIVLPLPNVTGTLHIGHAAMLAIQDLMTRYHRMKGEKALWVPGTDSAAVATEAKVEKMLIEKEGVQKPKEVLGREKFLDRVNQFAAESHDIIVDQLRKMGSSLDWSREAFTLDEPRYKAVYTVFKKMFDDGLIYRGNRVINWSVKGQSTCSDDELVHLERAAKLYTFKYSKDFPIGIASTRPETKLGDTAVAVNPKDKRYKKYIGQIFTVDVGAAKPLEIKIIADNQVEMEFGTGAVGVTPAHSSVDFEMYNRQKAKGEPINLIQVVGEDGKMTVNAGKEYQGLTTIEAREKFVAYLEKNNLIDKIEDITQNVGTSDRFGDVVEALPKTQWFIDVNKEFSFQQSKRNPIEGLKDGEKTSLKKLMQHVVRAGDVKIVPNRFDKVYFHWIDNLRDWCISRQIWYGHRIPVWYKEDQTYVDVKPPTGEGWQQDPDTLDTWFSSGLWTFSTLGYPDLDHSDLKTFHPTSVLETGYDILFFWVARMILMSTYAMGEIPFHTVYLHGLVRDEQGRKMSKSLGNVINPLDTIKQYGADATRLSLLIGNTPGNDTRLSEEKVAGFKNFTNKLWNISRFMLLNISETRTRFDGLEPKTLSDKWILHELSEIIKKVTADLENYRFSAAGEALRDFTWNKLADWYLEIAKIEGSKSMILNFVLNNVLKLWHPFMPFVTEAIWSQVYGEEKMLMVEKWPEYNFEMTEKEVKDFELIQNMITAVRALRAEYGITPDKKPDIHLITSEDKAEELFKLLHPEDGNDAVFMSLSRAQDLTIGYQMSEIWKTVSKIVGSVEVHVDMEGIVDAEKERARIEKEIAHVEPFVQALEKKLQNAKFVENAPEQVIETEKKKLVEAKEKLDKLKENFNSF